MRNTRARGDKLITMKYIDMNTKRLKRIYIRKLKKVWYYESHDLDLLAKDPRSVLRAVQSELNHRGVWLP